MLITIWGGGGGGGGGGALSSDPLACILTDTAITLPLLHMYMHGVIREVHLGSRCKDTSYKTSESKKLNVIRLSCRAGTSSK